MAVSGEYENYSFENFFKEVKSIKYNLAHNVMDFGSAPSLECLVVSNFVVSLWKQCYICVKNVGVCPMKCTCLNLDLVNKKVFEKLNQSAIHLRYKKKIELIIPLVREELDYFFDFNNRVPEEKREIYFRNICWTGQGRINYLKTAISLVNEANLEPMEKYEIACNNCLEDKIRDLLFKYPEIYEQSIINDHIILRVWTYYTHDKVFPKNGYPMVNRPQLLNHIITENNVVALQYFLENIADETMKQYFWKNIADETMNANLRDILKRKNLSQQGKPIFRMFLYMLQQLNLAQLQEICIENGRHVLEVLYHFSMWVNAIDSAARYILLILRKMSVSNALSVVLFCWHKKILNLDQYLTTWNEICQHFKHTIKVSFETIFNRIFFQIVNANDLQSAELLFKMSTFEEKKLMMFGPTVNLALQSLISRGCLKLFNTFLGGMLPVNEIPEFKNTYFKELNLELYIDYIEMDKFDLFDKFLYGLNDEELKALKKNVPYRRKSYLIKCILRYSIKNGFNHVQNGNYWELKTMKRFLNWCFGGNEEEIEIFKKRVIPLGKDVLEFMNGPNYNPIVWPPY